MEYFQTQSFVKFWWWEYSITKGHMALAFGVILANVEFWFDEKDGNIILSRVKLLKYLGIFFITWNNVWRRKWKYFITNSQIAQITNLEYHEISIEYVWKS